MKVEGTRSTDFNLITVTLIIETQAEFDVLYALTNLSINKVSGVTNLSINTATKGNCYNLWDLLNSFTTNV